MQRLHNVTRCYNYHDRINLVEMQVNVDNHIPNVRQWLAIQQVRWWWYGGKDGAERAVGGRAL